MADINGSFNRRPTAVMFAKLVRRMAATAADRGRLVIGAGLDLAGVALGIGGPYALKLLVDGLYAGSLTVAQMIGLVAAFALSWSSASICATARIVFSARLIDGVAGALVGDVLAARLPPMATAKDADSGRIHGLIERLPFSLLVVLDGLIWRAAPLAIQVAVTLAVIGVLANWHYIAILVLLLAVYVYASRIGADRHQRLSRKAADVVGASSANTADVLRNARRVVLNGATDMEIAGVEATYRDRSAANRSVNWSLVRLVTIQYGGLSLGLFGLLLVAGLDVIHHRVTAGDFVLLQAYALRLIIPLSGYAFSLTQASGAITNIRDIMDLTKTTADGTGHNGSGEGGGLVLENVGFSYGPGAPGLSNVTVDIPPGSFVAVVGPNGTGKSTLGQLMAGLLEPTAGRVVVGGIDLSHISRRNRHKYVLYVPQFVGLMNRSMRENLL